jgi:hypothetical protein
VATNLCHGKKNRLRGQSFGNLRFSRGWYHQMHCFKRFPTILVYGFVCLAPRPKPVRSPQTLYCSIVIGFTVRSTLADLHLLPRQHVSGRPVATYAGSFATNQGSKPTSRNLPTRTQGTKRDTTPVQSSRVVNRSGLIEGIRIVWDVLKRKNLKVSKTA